jgi:hypothetical protein
METFLTLLIALGGIATGIGAIWAALAARRQGQISERQAQLTERSLAQTERSLAEQNERARRTLEYDLLTRMADRIESSHFRSRRRAAARYLLNNAFVGDDIVELPSVPSALGEVCDFFEEVGELLRQGILRAETVWTRYGLAAQAYWLVCKPTIGKRREEWEEAALYEEFEYLCRVVAEQDRKRGIPVPTQERVRQFMEGQATIDEEPFEEDA